MAVNLSGLLLKVSVKIFADHFQRLGRQRTRKFLCPLYHSCSLQYARNTIQCKTCS